MAPKESVDPPVQDTPAEPAEPELQLHPDSVCNRCPLLADGACIYLQPTLDEQRVQAAPVSACSQFDATGADAPSIQTPGE